MSNPSSSFTSSSPSRKRPSADIADPLTTPSPRSSLPPRPPSSAAAPASSTPKSRLAVILSSQSHRPGYQTYTSSSQQGDDISEPPSSNITSPKFVALPAIKQKKKRGFPRLGTANYPPASAPGVPSSSRRNSRSTLPVLGKPSPALRPALAAELEAGRLAREAARRKASVSEEEPEPMDTATMEPSRVSPSRLISESALASTLPSTPELIVELPPPVTKPAQEEPALEEPVIGRSASVVPVIEESTPEESAMDESSPEESVMEEPTPEMPVMGEPPSISLPERPAQSPKPAPTEQPFPAKGRGRPKGWKPGMSYAKMRGTEPRASNPRQAKPKPGQMDVRKRRGRPPKKATPPPRDLYYKVEAAFVKFLCEWRGCKAELQNLETLKRHIDYIHLERQEGKWYCEWGTCGRIENGCAFPSFDKLAAHMKAKHMIPFAWHIGDGPTNRSGMKPKTSLEDEVIPRWLRDNDGKQVTPSVQDQQIEDYNTWRDNRRKLKELLLERDRNMPSESEAEELT